MSVCPVTGKPCNKARVYKITELTNGKVESLELCLDCAASYLKKDKSKKVKELPSHLKIMDLLQHLGITNHSSENPCPKCGSTFNDLMESQKVGCANCYDHFNQELNLIIKVAQKGATQHTGKVIKNQSSNTHTIESYCEQRQQAMDKAVKIENYKKAAIVRDELQAFKTLDGRLKESIANEDFKQATLIRREMQKFIDSSATKQTLSD